MRRLLRSATFKTVLGTTLAVPAIRLTAKLSLIYQLQLVTKIPLAH